MHRITLYLRICQNLSHNVRLYFITTALIGFTLGGMHALLFNLYLSRLGYGPEFIGLINGAGMWAFALFSLPAGRLNHHWGSRLTMLVGLATIVLGYSLLLLPRLDEGIFRNSWFLITFVLISIGSATFFVNTAPFLMESASLEERSHVFSIYAAIGALSGFTGSLVGGFLPLLLSSLLGTSTDHPAPYRYSLLIASLLMASAILPIRATTSTNSHCRETPREQTNVGPAAISLILLLTLIRLLVTSGMSVMSSFFNVYLDRQLNIPTPQIGVVLAISTLMCVPTALTVPFLSGRLGNGTSALCASLGTVLAVIPVALVPHWGVASLGFMGVLAFSTIRYPAFLVYTMNAVSTEQRGMMSGAGEMAAGLSFGTMALVGGYIITRLGYSSLFITSAVLTGLGCLILWLHLRQRKT